MTPGIPVAPPMAAWRRERSSSATSRKRSWRQDFTEFAEPTFTDIPNPVVREKTTYVALFYCGDFWDSRLTYLELQGNECNLDDLRSSLREANRLHPPHGRDAHLLNWDNPLSESVVCELLAVGEGEALRPLLTAHVQAPFAGGWKDCNQWVVRNMEQLTLNGQLARFPEIPAASYRFLLHIDTEWKAHLYRLVGFHLQYYVRAWDYREQRRRLQRAVSYPPRTV